MKLSDIHFTLCEVRKERALSQKDIATALNVEQATISMYENGKRGIPLDLLDAWLQQLEIEVRIIPKGLEPLKPAVDIKKDLDRFNDLKARRNYLIAELRALMAEKLHKVPEFNRINEKSGECCFWPYSFPADESVGLVETRYDHPEQKYLAVEYTKEEVNVYKFLLSHESVDEKSNHEQFNVNRIYFSEDDFLTASALWDLDDIEMRKVTILRKSSVHTDGVEIIDPEGFSIRTLVELMENHKLFAEAVSDLELDWKYIKMEQELESVGDEMLNIVLNNKLANGTPNPDFVFWNDEDISATDVPLGEFPRSWVWVTEGIEWVEEFTEPLEIQLLDDQIPHDQFHTHLNADGSRVVGLIGSENMPALFKSNPNKPNTIYRVKTPVEDLNDIELAAYHSILNATGNLNELRTSHDDGAE